MKSRSHAGSRWRLGAGARVAYGALGSVALATLAVSACSTRVSLGGAAAEGGAGDVPVTTGPPGGMGNTGGDGSGGGVDPCVGMPCGAGCEVIYDCDERGTCVGYPGFCDGGGSCVPDPPPCVRESCSNQPCGTPCPVCSTPDCDRPEPGALFCDGYGSCLPSVYCEPCQPSYDEPGYPFCGEPCDPCQGIFPRSGECPPQPWTTVCDGFGQCVEWPELMCPSYDSCLDDPSAVCGMPCSLCAPNSPDYQTCIEQESMGPLHVCDANLTCVSTELVFPECM